MRIRAYGQVVIAFVMTGALVRSLPAATPAVESATSRASPSFGTLIVDLEQDGLNLSTVADGVNFDTDGDGRREQIAWTSRNSHNAFLAIDLNNNGRIDSGAELISTEFRKKGGLRAREGFDAIVDMYQALGVKKGGILDGRDGDFRQLLLWVDKNHNGVSEPSELATMAGAGIVSIATRYSLVPPPQQRTTSGSLLQYSGTAFLSRRGVDFPRQITHVRLATQ